MTNSNLHDAKVAKNDEFYTRIEDINEELKHYEDKFRDKVVFCNCDDPKWSNFWKYFHISFEQLGLKKLIATHYEPGEVQSYKIEYFGGDDLDCEVGTTTPLQQNGDFRSDECIELLNESDIVVTNPPFSLFREYVAQLVEYDKTFLIIGNKNSITYKEIFPLLRDNRIWIGYSNPSEFSLPDGTTTKRVNGLCRWFTNIDIEKRHEFIETSYFYSKKDELYPDLYPHYDNYDAINVDKVNQIPMDYEPCWYKCPHSGICRYGVSEGTEDNALCEKTCNGEIGVPITFLDKHNSAQFEIMGNAGSYNGEGSVCDELWISNKCSQFDNVERASERERERDVAKSTNGLSFAECRKCNGVMGVPITFLDKYNPDQFEIVAFRKGEDGKDLVFTREREREFNRTFASLYDGCSRSDEQSERYKSEWEKHLCQSNGQTEVEPIDYFFPLSTKRAAGTMNGLLDEKETYRRILIQRKAE